jgi:redox-sensitive bicupin YhaK (pirin superfamily)
MKIRPANTRGHLQAGWIESRRTFSNNSYWDPRYINYSDLEVINDDVVQPGGTVPNHEHKNMEIFGYVVQGPCTHVDNLGNNCVVQSGGVQRMSAGSGIWHTEGNNSTSPIRYLQLWIKPSVENTKPDYSNYTFAQQDRDNKFFDITSVLPIQQDVRFYTGVFTENYEFTLKLTRRYYLYVVSGETSINGQASIEGDGYAFEQETQLTITNPNAEIILFDLR